MRSQSWVLSIVLFFSESLARSCSTLTTFDGYYRIKEVSSGNLLDAYDQHYYSDRPGFEAVVRPEQFAKVRDGVDKTQIWYILRNEYGSYSLMQYTSGRFLDVVYNNHGNWKLNMAVMTRPANDSQFATSQRWLLQHVDAGKDGNQVHVVHADTGKYLDAYQSADKDFQALLKDQDLTALGLKRQAWVLEKMNDSPVPFLDGIFTITQDSTQLLLDAEENGTVLDCYTNRLTFRESQHFIIRRVKGEIYTIMQRSTGRFIGAKVKPGSASAEVSADLVLTDNTQQWMMIYIKYNTFVFQHVSTGRILDASPKGAATSSRLAFGAMPTLGAYDGNLTNELWTVQRIGFAPKLSGIYRFVNAKRGKVLQGSAAGGSVTAVPQDARGDNEYFAIAQIAGDIFEIYSNKTHQILSDKRQLVLSATEAKALLQTATTPVHAAKHPSEQWFMRWISGEQFYVMNSKTRKYLDVDRNGIVSTSDLGHSGSQIWTLEKVTPICTERLSKCPRIYQCGFVDDWCGGKVICGLNSAASNDDGTCKGVNRVTGTPYSCNVEHLCECVHKATCSSGASCGTEEDDGCGGYISCGACPPSLPAPAPVPAAALASPAPPAPLLLRAPAPAQWLPITTAANTCVKKTMCDKGAQCGEQSDGCGGILKCGDAQGKCAGGGNFKCKANACVCTPSSCGKRCGQPVDDGCGSKLTCKCTMANEVCDHKAGICQNVPGPTPDPALFEPTKLPKPVTKKLKKGRAEALTPLTPTEAPLAAPAAALGFAPGPSPFLVGMAPVAAVAASPAPALSAPAPAPVFVIQQPVLPGLVHGQHPPPKVPPPAVPSNVEPNMVEHYTYFYYVYYYYGYLGQKDAGAKDADAAAHAQRMAPVYAAEQLKHMVKQGQSSQPTQVSLPPLPAFHGLPTSDEDSEGQESKPQPSVDMTLATAIEWLQSSRVDQSRAWEEALAAAAGTMQAVTFLQQRSALRGVTLRRNRDVGQ